VRYVDRLLRQSGVLPPLRPAVRPEAVAAPATPAEGLLESDEEVLRPTAAPATLPGPPTPPSAANAAAADIRPALGEAQRPARPATPAAPRPQPSAAPAVRPAGLLPPAPPAPDLEAVEAAAEPAAAMLQRIRIWVAAGQASAPATPAQRSPDLSPAAPAGEARPAAAAAAVAHGAAPLPRPTPRTVLAAPAQPEQPLVQVRRTPAELAAERAPRAAALEREIAVSIGSISVTVEAEAPRRPAAPPPRPAAVAPAAAAREPVRSAAGRLARRYLAP